MDDDAIEAFWVLARRGARFGNLPGYLGPSTLEVLTPPAWSFGTDPAQADRLLELVLEGTKTATSSAREDYDLAGERLPEPGSLGVVLDGQGRPRALVAVTAVEVKPFDQVSEADAYAEGEGTRTLAEWRTAHEDLFTRHDPYDRGFRPDMPVVVERLEVLYRE